MAEREKWGKSTTALHAGYSPVPMDMTRFRSFVPPLIQSAIFPLSDVDHYTRIVHGEEPGFDYGRNSNPTVDVLNKRLAALEGGEASGVDITLIPEHDFVMEHVIELLSMRKLAGRAEPSLLFVQQ